MRSQAPSLLPIFRSRHQADLLAWLYLHPDAEFQAIDLANRLGIPPSTLHRELQRLIDAGLLRDRTVGRSRLLRAAVDHPAAEPLTRLLTVSFGPPAVVNEAFADVPGVEGLYVFGSWAARYFGRPGAAPNDVDVLVVGSPARADVYAAADAAQERLALPVNPTIRTPQQWHDASDGLVREIKASPYVTLITPDAAPPTA
ncbi:winged helix-turn-helix domain-containing protein [Dactylosporangium sp. AC04546]|uniref:MarR family transcriptional regulator n=1 Tax=Dactylosporangium sp. AC04546 TaxID=2862460 RepID=UPI001EDDFC58|nr:winged helix-turn-helix domain-containing protein [Dactylosporangium sp. AC04546]WVK84374.1 winged helix-turn-helix domain-containing protein [Dactylosporangium sp. AC04546]